MRIKLTALVALALLWPAAAVAVDPADCARLIRQHQHYEGMADRAAQLGNEQWEAGMRQHVAVIEAQLDNRCPEYTAEKKAVKKAIADFVEFLKIAGKAALTFFTMGAM